MVRKTNLPSSNHIREQLSKGLADLQRYLEDLWHFIPLPLCYVNPTGIILESNELLGGLVGRAPADLIGQPIEHIFKDERKAALFHQKILKSKQVAQRLEIDTAKRGPGTFQVLANAREDQDGNIIGYYVALLDITQQQQLQAGLEQKVRERVQELQAKTQDLEKSRQALLNILEDVEEARRSAEQERVKVRAIIDNFADGLLFFDKTGLLQLFNPRAEKMFNIAADQVLSKNISQLTQVSNKLLAELAKKLSEQRNIIREELFSESEQVLEITQVAVWREQERLGSLVVTHDITREKRIERLKSEFVSVAAHQLRTPLSTIKWTMRMLLDGDLGILNKEQLEFIERTYLSNERMINVVNDLLNVAKIEEGRYVADMKSVGLEKLVQEVVNGFKEALTRKKIKFAFLRPLQSLPQIKADSEKLKLAVQNLLDNALKYTPSGGQITVALRQAERNVEFSVQDSGVGIPADQQERVFSRFFRGSNITRLETSGTGLGSFITKNIIDAHGGKIWFESQEGKGSTFYFTLPAVGEPKGALRRLYERIVE